MVDEETVRDLVKVVGAETARELVDAFVEEGRERVGLMAGLDGDLAALERQAHALKSSAWAYGLKGLGDVARDLEFACRDGDADRAGRSLAAIVTDAGPAFDALADFCDRDSTHQPDPPAA